jgi:hypothetical protein
MIFRRFFSVNCQDLIDIDIVISINGTFEAALKDEPTSDWMDDRAG